MSSPYLTNHQSFGSIDLRGHSRANVGNFSYSTKVQGDQHVHNSEEDVLKHLAIAAQATYHATKQQDDPICLRNTRESVLNEIDDWLHADGDRHILWLNGAAGRGKSTIARTVCKKLERNGSLGASYFFSRSDESTSSADRFVSTIAYELAQSQNKEVRQAICSILKEQPHLLQESLQRQWDSLIIGSLSHVPLDDGHFQGVVIVVDALDECGNESQIKAIISLMAQARVISTVSLRLVVTSRPEPVIKDAFRIVSVGCHSLMLDNVRPVDIDGDLHVFIQDRFADLRRKRSLRVDWPGTDVIARAVKQAAGLFIFASTLCNLIEEAEDSPEKSLGYFLKDAVNREEDADVCSSPTETLDDLYSQVIASAIGKSKHPSKLLTNMIRALGWLTVIREPLSISALASLTGIPARDISWPLRNLQSVIKVPGLQDDAPVELYHESFRDFLHDPTRSTRRTGDLLLDVVSVHGDLATRSIRLLQSAVLKRDMCGLEAPGRLKAEVDARKIKECIPSAVSYACRHAVPHHMYSKATAEQSRAMHSIFAKVLLFWIETMAWVSHLGDCIRHMRMMMDHANLTDGAEGFAFYYDAWRFLLRSSTMIDGAPLQVYASALVFAPARSVVKRTFEDQMPRWISLFPRVTSDWSSELLKLEGHENSVWSVCFSPDGKQVASASDDTTVRIWDAVTGAETHKLEGHESYVQSVCFSPDGKQVASASDDRTVRIWDAVTGAETHKLEGHENAVRFVCFSPDGKQVASASWDKTVRIWDAVTGAEAHKLEGHEGRVLSVCFSPDGKQVASASDDETVRIWDAEAGIELETLHQQSLPTRFTDSTYKDENDAHLVELAVTDDWISLDGRNTLLLPFEYRGGKVAVRGNTLAIGQRSGGVMFLTARGSRA